MSVDAPSPASPPDVRAEATVPWRPTAGAMTTAAGAAVVALAMVLPWCSIPGGAYARALLELRGEAVPATGPLWRSLPLTSVVVLGLVVLAVVAVALSVTAHRLRRRVAWATAGSGVLVAALLVDRLFVERPAPDVTEVGAGGYVGLAGVLAVTVGAGLVAREHEATARDPRATRAVSPAARDEAARPGARLAVVRRRRCRAGRDLPRHPPVVRRPLPLLLRRGALRGPRGAGGPVPYGRVRGPGVRPGTAHDVAGGRVGGAGLRPADLRAPRLGAGGPADRRRRRPPRAIGPGARGGLGRRGAVRGAPLLRRP